MKQRILRGTGATVSQVCLGTMTFGQQVDEKEADRILGIAMDGVLTLSIQLMCM